MDNNDRPAADMLPPQLPLPLVQLGRRAQNAKTSYERHLAAYFLWEASLKLLGSVALVRYSEAGRRDPLIVDRLKALGRPSIGHWWELIRRLTHELAGAGDPGFARLRDELFRASRADLPRATALDLALAESLGGTAPNRSTVCLAELFDRMVSYRNQEIGHGATGQRSGRYYERLARLLLAGVAQSLERIDVLAGSRLVYVDEVRLRSDGGWLVDRLELSGDSPRRLDPLPIVGSPEAGRPLPDRVYLESGPGASGQARFLGLQPFVHYSPEAGTFFFYNARRGRRCSDYLCYQNGEKARLEPDLGRDPLLAEALSWSGPDREEAGAAADREVPGEAPRPGDEGGDEDGPEFRNLGGYELLSRIGQGGMGVVCRAWQPSLGRQVAVKCLLRAGDARAEARFAREIRALGRIDHPNVVKVFTTEVAGDRWFYVMELIDGTDLDTFIERASAVGLARIDRASLVEILRESCRLTRAREVPLGAGRSGEYPAPPAREPLSSTGEEAPSGDEGPLGSAYRAWVVSIVRKASEAAQALHAAGIVHRDIKPGNIMISADGGTPVLMDLGLAQVADDGRLTHTREFVGSIRYASPEQVLAVGEVDHRTDVYSLGVVLWELLTLRPMFDADDRTPTSELMRRIQVKEPTSPRAADPAISRDLEAVVMKCLEKDRDRRYAAASDLASDLGRCLAGEPVRARRRGPAARLLRRCRRWIVPVASAGAILGTSWLALADLGFSLPGSRVVRDSLDRYGLSPFRPAPSTSRLKAAAADQRRHLIDHLMGSVVTPEGWVTPGPVMKDHSDAWTQFQVSTALFSIPAAERRDLAGCARAMVQLFEPNKFVDPFVPGFGWPNFNDGEPSAEPLGWGLSALSLAIAHPESGSRARVPELTRLLDRVEEALENFRSREAPGGRPNGGWNLFPHQEDPSRANPYITTLVCQGLLDMRGAGIPWRRGGESRDELLRGSMDWLLGEYNGRGWLTPGRLAAEFDDGLTLQVFAILLRGERDGLVRLPAGVTARIPGHLSECDGRPLNYPIHVALFTEAFVNPRGKRVDRPLRPIRTLWYPWAIQCARLWLLRCQSIGAPHEEIVRARRVLGHLLLTLDDDSIKEAKSGMTYVIGETLLALDGVDEL